MFEWFRFDQKRPVHLFLLYLLSCQLFTWMGTLFLRHTWNWSATTYRFLGRWKVRLWRYWTSKALWIPPISIQPTTSTDSFPMVSYRSGKAFNLIRTFWYLWKEQSLSTIDTVLDKLAKKTEDLGRETERLTTAQTIMGKQGTEEELGKTKDTIKVKMTGPRYTLNSCYSPSLL